MLDVVRSRATRIRIHHDMIIWIRFSKHQLKLWACYFVLKLNCYLLLCFISENIIEFYVDFEFSKN